MATISFFGTYYYNPYSCIVVIATSVHHQFLTIAVQS
jgi:hypothetical protein